MSPSDAPDLPAEETQDASQLDDELPRDHTPQPDVPNPAAVSMERCFELVFALGRAHPNVGEAVAFDPGTACVLWTLLGRVHELTDNGSAVRVPVGAIAGACNLSLKRVRWRLELLAAFGLLQAVNERDQVRKFYTISNFYFNPLMVQLVLKRGGRKLSKSALEPFVTMGLARDPQVRRPQGWRGYDVEYGELEPTPGTATGATKTLALWARTLGDELGALEEAASTVSAISASKRLRAMERLRRAALAERFVAGCATIWQQAHEKRGFGTGRPAWEGPFEGLSPSNKQQYNELKKLFERFGGKTVAMAWACFVNYQPFTDERGKLKFDPNLPHVQWVSSDKKPNHFAKHFDAVLLDPVVRQRVADDGACQRIGAILGSVFEVPPAPPLAVAAQKGGKA